MGSEGPLDTAQQVERTVRGLDRRFLTGPAENSGPESPHQSSPGKKSAAAGIFTTGNID